MKEKIEETIDKYISALIKNEDMKFLLKTFSNIVNPSDSNFSIKYVKISLWKFY